MKIIFLTIVEIDNSSGVYKKILEQCESFVRHGHECKVLFLTDEDDYFYSIENNSGFLAKTDHNDIMDFISQCQVCYSRFELLRHKKYKKYLNIILNKGIRLITEIPTFPPAQESIARVKEKIRKKEFFSALKTLIGVLVIKHNLNYTAKKSFCVCIVANDYKFKKTKTIRIENGIDVYSKPFLYSKKREHINIIAVSNFAVWNGYDRIIRSLSVYYKSNPDILVNLTFVGPLDKANDLIKLSSSLSLEKHVLFTGALSGEKLDNAFYKADIALGSLGNHRRKVFSNSSLKIKEYASRGMLMILTDSEYIEKEISDLSYIIKSDESLVNVFDIVKWYININNTNEVRRKIHEFAISHYSWDLQISKILHEIMQ